jgi:DNA-binding IclR family transcriptional regulator
MRLSEGDVVCGVAATTARAAVRAVEEAQWCSAGALARRLGMDPAACRTLLEALEADCYLNKPVPRTVAGGAWQRVAAR